MVRNFPKLIAVAAWMMLAAPAQRTSELPLQDRVLPAELTDELVVGRAAGAEHEMLFGVVDVAFGRDGTLFVLEQQGGRVLAYGPDGAFQRAFGRRGQGPGEFGRPVSIAVSGGEVVIWDSGRRAYLVFALDGTHLRDVSRSERNLRPGPDSLLAWPAGGVVHLPTLLQLPDEPVDQRDRGTIILDPVQPATDPRPLVEVRHPRNLMQRVGSVALIRQGPEFGPKARWAPLSDGRLAIVDSTAYRVRLVDADGATLALIERPLSPRPVTDADRQLVLAKERASMERPVRALSAGGAGGGSGGGGRTVPAAQIDAMLDAIEFADVIPVIRNLAVDTADRLWIQRHGESAFSPEGPIDLVTAAGDYVGTLPPMRFPDAFGPDGRLAWMESGEDFDIERVVVRRLSGGR